MNNPDERTVSILGRLAGLEMIVAGLLVQSPPDARKRAFGIAEMLLATYEEQAESDAIAGAQSMSAETASTILDAARAMIQTFKGSIAT